MKFEIIEQIGTLPVISYDDYKQLILDNFSEDVPFNNDFAVALDDKYLLLTKVMVAPSNGKPIFASSYHAKDELTLLYTKMGGAL